MKRLRITSAVFVCMAVSTVMSPVAANAQVSPPWDQYLCYAGKSLDKPVQDPPVVGLADEFVTADYDPNKAKLFCAPDMKDQFFDTATHLTVYPIKRVTPGKEPLPRFVQTDDQFGPQVLKVLRLSDLMVPTAKDLTSPPSPPDPAAYSYEHYKCYTVGGGKNLKMTVQLLDQFGPRTDVIGKAAKLCSPVEKNDAGQIDPIRNPDRHLLCYTVSKPDSLKVPAVFGTNQFGGQHLKLLSEKRLCVPATVELLP